MTSRSLRDTLVNALDFLTNRKLVAYAGTVALTDKQVGWHGLPTVPFLLEYGHATSDQYLRWVSGGHYSALLNDGSLLQLTYRLEEGDVAGHRLAYIPCPVIVDKDLLEDGEPVGDIVQLYLETQPTTAIVLRSAIRFDFDPAASSDRHPAAHMTINGPDCRIACVAPLHPYRFIDFIFRHFYPALRAEEGQWFDEASKRSLGKQVLAEADAQNLHLMWKTQ